MTTPETIRGEEALAGGRPADPFSAEFVAAVANELFAAFSPTSEVGAVPEASAPQLPNEPARAADITSTAAAPAPSTGVADIYVRGAEIMAGRLSDEQDYAAIAAEFADLLSLVDVSAAPAEEVAVPPAEAPQDELPQTEPLLDAAGFDLPTTIDASSTSVAPAPSYGVATAQSGAVSSVVPQAPVSLSDIVGELPDADQLLDSAAGVPTSAPAAHEAATGDHPYLESKYDRLVEVGGLGEAPSVESEPDVGSTVVPDLEPTAEATVEPTPEPAHEPTAYRPVVVDQTDPIPELDIPPTTTGFNAERLRDDFPILREQIHGRRLVWLDNGATTQKPQRVIDRLSYFYAHENSNVHRTAHTLAGRATDAYEGARDKVRGFLNAASADDIVWVRGTTEGINLLANTIGEQRVCEGDEVLISWLEHHANIVPWQMLCQRKGAVLKVAPVDDTGQIILSEYERLITPRTKLISFTQVSNALGTITPAAAMVEIAHRHDVPVIIDGAQGVPHTKVDVQALDCDFYVFSGHKMFAPTGIGAVYGKQERLASMPPWQGGGNMIDQVYFDRTTYQAPPWRFEAGTGNIADAVGLGEAIDYLDEIGMSNIAAYEHTLLDYGTGLLSEVPGLHIYGHARDKAGILSFNVDGHDPVSVGEYLDRCGIAVRAGHHCAQPILRRFGVEATVRAALALYNTHDDLDRLAGALHRLVAGTPPEVQ